MATAFPFSAFVGQSAMTDALMIAAVDPSVGGVLVLGDRGTGKSTVVRALADLLPKMAVVDGCAYHCDPAEDASRCVAGCPRRDGAAKPKTRQVPVPVVDLPLGVSEDRVVGALDLEKALTSGEKSFEPGLLAAANRGFLYIDEVNLLEDHIVDLLLDVAASGENVVEREGLSVRHPARFVLIGSGNPEEGDLRPQMLDRFGLAVSVSTPKNIKDRIEIIRRRDAFDRDPQAFREKYKRKDAALRRRIVKAREGLRQVTVPEPYLEKAAELCLALGTDGLRGELTLVRAGRARAALQGRSEATGDDLKAVAPLVLAHRLRRDPLDDVAGETRVDLAIGKVLEPAVAHAG